MIDLPIKANVILNKKWTGKIVDFELTPIKYNAEDDGCDRCPDDDTPDAYGIYARKENSEGLIVPEWIGDFDNKEAAESLLSLLQFIFIQNSNADQLPANTDGLVHLASVHGYYDPVSGASYNYTAQGIDMLNPIQLDEIEVGDWFRSLTDDEWGMVTTGAYQNLCKYTKEEIAEFVDGYTTVVPLSDIIDKIEAENSGQYDCYTVSNGTEIYHK